jgi:ankyrin repeat protein/Mg-chelatase subunit ChlD
MSIPTELVDPITFDLFVDPIALPCCGRAISRASITQCFDTSSLCPLCCQDLESFNFDPNSVPRLRNIEYMVEAYNATLVTQNATQNTSQQTETDKKNHIATVKKVPRDANSSYKTEIGHLSFDTLNANTFKTLLLCVIDKSGSMSGNPFEQVKYSLNRLMDLTFNNDNLETNIISYNDTATTINVDTSSSVNHYYDLIKRMSAGGGTSFKSAFNEIVNQINKYKNNPMITSLVVVFMTDGEDSSVSKQNRHTLVTNVQSSIQAVWSESFIVHTIGFGAGHDFDFLTSLATIGTSSGSYRYADHGMDFDSLSNKINSVLDVIATSSSVPIELVTQLPIIGKVNQNDKTKYWINLTNYELPNNIGVKIGSEHFDVLIETKDCESVDQEEKLKDLWYSHLVDEIANELVSLNNVQTNIDKEIHLELLTNRSKAIKIRLTNSDIIDRLTKLGESIEVMKSGGSVNKFSLTDLAHEGTYATKNVPKQVKGDPVKQGSVYKQSDDTKRSFDANKVSHWVTQKMSSYNRLHSDTFYREIIEKYSGSTDEIYRNINNCKLFNPNILNYLCYTGRFGVIKCVLNKFPTCVNNQDPFNNNMTPLDIAVVRGYYRTFDELIVFGAKTTIDGKLLIQTVLENRHVITAGKLLKNNISTITDEMIDNAPTNEILQWLSQRQNRNINFEIAIAKGMEEIVANKINAESKIEKLSVAPYLSVFEKTTKEHVNIVEMLCKNNIFDIDEIVVQNELITWPLFVACENGNKQMFDVLKKYASRENVNRQNERGTTCLWIACCNNHVDIVMELLDMGADPNIANIKGDGPLIPCCQKRHLSIAELLLASGCDIFKHNQNRDNPILIACRTGQADILELLFNNLNKQQIKTMLNTYAEIDGLVPLLASTELDKTSCIKVCHKYGANLETKTEPNNQIIADATAVNLAAHYGREASLRTLQLLGANMKSTEKNGQNILHIAIKNGHINCVRYILTLDCYKELLEMKDNNGNLPAYYAKMMGNEGLFNEFFVDKLAIKLEKVLNTNCTTQENTIETLLNYGQSLGCYEYSDLAKVNMCENLSLMSYAILNGNSEFYSLDIPKNDQDLFWASLLGCDMSENNNALERVKKVKEQFAKSIQTKMLINIKSGIPLLTYTDVEEIVKMNDGYDVNIPENTIENLSTQDQSLIGFIEKLRQKKYFADGSDCLEYLLWSAKVNLVRILSELDDTVTVNPIHIMALYLYSSNLTIFQSVSKTLMNWNDNSVFHPFVNCLHQAIKSLPSSDAEVYRAVDTHFDPNVYKVGNVLTWCMFSTCSTEYSTVTDLINKKKGIIFVIQSKQGRNISKYSKVKANGEVVFLPFTQLKITNHYVATTICLCQKNIRQSTFAIRDKETEEFCLNKESYFTKACNSEACIIVELQDL